MLSLPFCFEGLWVLEWLSLSVLICSIYCRKVSLKRVFCSLFCFFYLFYFCVYSWFVNLYPMDFAGLGNFESVAVILCGILLIPLLQTTVMSICLFAGYFLSNNCKNTVVKVISFSSAFVVGEFLMSYGTFAFPWATLCLSQTQRLENLQSISVLGSYFVSFLIVLVNALLAFSAMKLKNGDKKRALCFVLCAVGIFCVNFSYGVYEMKRDLPSEKLNVLVLQGNIASGEKWQEDADHKNVYYHLAKKAQNELSGKGFTPDITLLPETAFPVTLVKNGKIPYSSQDDVKVLCDISVLLDTELLFGAFSEDKQEVYNSVFCISKGEISQEIYSKHNIVPFGEFLPYRKILTRVMPFFESINMLSYDLSRGQEYEPLNTQKVKAGCLVCFDSIFEKTSRLQVKNGAEILCVSTNDSWYKTSSALYQHARHSVLRAIENKVCVVRSANTGISLVVDRCGRISDKIDVNQRSYIYSCLDVTTPHALYTRIGNVFVYICFVWLLVCVVLKIKNSRTKVREN